MHRSNPNWTRRRFIERTGAGTTALLAAATGPGLPHSRGAEAEKLEIGFIGLRSRGTELLNEFLANPQVQVAWLCDVDQRALDKAGQTVAGRQVRAFKTTPDFRRILDDRRTQAVVIATPDHWHAPASVLAVKAGKAVYVEPPFSHNPREGEILVDLVRRNRGLLRVGLQRRSVPWIQEILQRVRSGEFGNIHFARAWHTAHRPGIGFGRLAPVPEWLNYELWQGPAPDRPYRDNVVHDNWSSFWHWGTGDLGTHGVHWLDLARWGLDLECPVRVSSAGGRYHFEDDQECPDTQVVTYDFGHQTLVWEHRSVLPQPLDGEPAGVSFLGEKGSVILGNTGYRILDPQGKELQKTAGSVPSAPHVGHFLASLPTRNEPPAASATEGHLSTLLCHLGNISQRLGRSIRVNPETRQVREDREAASLWHREYRPGWQPVL